MRAALASYLAGVGPDAEFEIEELLEEAYAQMPSADRTTADTSPP